MLLVALAHCPAVAVNLLPMAGVPTRVGLTVRLGRLAFVTRIDTPADIALR